MSDNQVSIHSLEDIPFKNTHCIYPLRHGQRTVLKVHPTPKGRRTWTGKPLMIRRDDALNLPYLVRLKVIDFQSPFFHNRVCQYLIENEIIGHFVGTVTYDNYNIPIAYLSPLLVLNDEMDYMTHSIVLGDKDFITRENND